MRLVLHPDPFRLEDELLSRLSEETRGVPFERVLVLVPTRRLARHVERRTAERLGGVLGVEVLHYRALVRRIRGNDDPAPAGPSPAPLLVSVLEGVLRGLPENPLAAFTKRRPAAVAALFSTIEELREAGVDSAALVAAGDGPLGDVLRGYETALRGRRKAGLLDEPAWIAETLPRAPGFAERYRAIFHHGAYETVGMHLDLLLALDRGREIVWLAPVARGSRATEYAERFFARHFPEALDRAEDPSVPATAPLSDRLDRIQGRGDAEEPIPGADEFLLARTAQGPESEAEAALRSALRAIADGVPPAEIAIVRRALDPYAPALEAILADSDLPVDAELPGPLRRNPSVRDLLLLLRVVRDDFPRRGTAEVLRFARPVAAGRVEAWSRSAGIVRGLASWERELPRWAGTARFREDAPREEIAREEARARERRGEAEGIAAALRALRDRLAPEARRRWTEHRAVLEALVADLFPAGAEGDGRSPIERLLRTMSELETVAGDARPVPLETALAWLERAVDGETLPAVEPVSGGIAVLDAMQARGLTFQRVILLGLNAGVFPRASREDPFLDDATRGRIREATGRPLGVKREGEGEERQILVAALGAAKAGLTVSWQRADAGGRARAASLALREVERLVRGRPDLASLRARAVPIPSHPAERLRALERESGILRPDEAVLLAALESGGSAEDAKGLEARDPALAPGLAMLLATESFAPRSMEFDGRTGRGLDPARGLSVSGMETLARCPLRFFFGEVLRVRELDEEADPFEASAKETGSAAHERLREIYETLDAEGLLFADPDAALARARELLDETPVASRGEMPVLDRLEARRWRSALLAFLADDLPRLAEEGGTIELEHSLVGRVFLPDGQEIPLRGRADRVVTTASGTVAGEYKTGSLGDRTNITKMLEGKALQVPLYHLLLGGAAVEVLGVGPAHDPASGAEEAGRRARFAGFENATQAEGFRETAGVVADLARRGVYPLVRDRHCAYCPYVPACRKDHPPTRDRHEVAPDTADFRDLARKNKSKLPTLASVRAGSVE